MIIPSEWPYQLAPLTLSLLICKTGLMNLYKDIDRLIFMKCFINIKAVGKSALENIIIMKRESLI